MRSALALCAFGAALSAVFPAAVVAFTSQSLALNAVTRGVIVPGTGDQSTLAKLATVGQPLVKVVMVPCFGDFSFYMKYGNGTTMTVPSKSNNNYACPATSSTQPCLNMDSTIVGFTRRGTVDAEFQILVEGLGAWSGNLGKGASAIVDFVIIDSDNASTADLIPALADTAVTVAVGDSNTKATLEWQLTGDPRDSYNIYEFEGEINEDSGYRSATACGAKLFMTDVTTSHKVTLGSTTGKAEITGLDPEVQYTYKIIVSRQGGYMKEYKTQVVNSSSRVMASILTLCLAFALALTSFV